MIAINKAVVPENVFKALMRAAPTDLQFIEEVSHTHPDIIGTKIGFRPTQVFGVDLPKALCAVYVRGQDSRGLYWYVISWLNSSDGKHHEIIVESESEAKYTVLNELKKGAIMEDSDFETLAK